MMRDILTVAWKEWREYLSQGGGRGKWYPLIFVAVFGIFMPLQSGRAWLETPISLAYLSWVPFLLGSGWAADSFAGERERHTLETLLSTRLPDEAILLGKVLAIVSYGWGLTLLTLLVSLLACNIALWAGHLIFFSGMVVAVDLVVSLLMSVLSVALGVLVSIRAPTVRQAAQKLSIGFLLIAWGPILLVNLAPASWREGAKDWVNQIAVRTDLARQAAAVGVGALVALAIADGVLLALARRRFRRARLLLD